MTNRRDFLVTAKNVAVGGLLLPAFSCGGGSQKKESDAASTAETESEPLVITKDVGVQAYSVRDALQEDFNGTLGKLADMGYKYIEAYGLSSDGLFLDKVPAADYKKIVSDLGMELVATHCGYFKPDQAQAFIDASLEAGLKYLVIPSLPNELKESVETYKQVAANLNEVGELFQGTGVRLGYHNHAFEFEQKEGRVPLEILLSETDPELVTFEADLYWVTKGGVDPMELINSYPGRFELFHVKDADQDLEQTTVGTGIIDFEALLSARETAGLKYYFVEDERTDDPFGNLQKALEYLNASDFA